MCENRKMRTERVRQENNTGFFSALKAGAAGAAAGAVARRVFPATASEVDSFTSSGTKNLAEAAKAAKKERPEKRRAGASITHRVAS